jgi:hypothetical protein
VFERLWIVVLVRSMSQVVDRAKVLSARSDQPAVILGYEVVGVQRARERRRLVQHCDVELQTFCGRVSWLGRHGHDGTSAPLVSGALLRLGTSNKQLITRSPTVFDSRVTGAIIERSRRAGLLRGLAVANRIMRRTFCAALLECPVLLSAGS